MATTALAVQDKRVELGLVKSHGAVILADQLATVTEQRALLVKFVHENLREGVDYGTIPGTPKPCLYKPGAEKLTDLYRCTAEPEVEKDTEDWEKGFFYYRYKVRIISRETSVCLGVGIGSCNSRETKYRWRDAKIKCPECGSETLFRSKDKPEWFCWAKKGGCGKTYPANDPRVVDQPRGRVENPDIADLVNTIQKMATKRAHVAAALQLAGCSDLFTQDLEDMPLENPVVPPEKNGGWAQRDEAAPEENPFPPDGPPGPPPAAAPQQPQRPPPTPAQLRTRSLRIWNAKQRQGLTTEGFHAWTAAQLGHKRPQPEWTEADLDKLETVLARELAKG